MSPSALEIGKSIRARGFCALNAPDWLAARYHGSDKVAHGYMQYYRKHFSYLRLRRLRIFEIGVGGYASSATGGSLQIWRDYFIRSTIIGLDIHAKEVRLGPRVRFMQADQRNPDDLMRAVAGHGPPDIVIDDGSHVGTDIQTSFDTLWPVVQDGGWYVIEDLATSYYPDFGGGDPPPRLTGAGIIRHLVDAVTSLDPAFDRWPEVGPVPQRSPLRVAAVHCYPGLALVQKQC